MDVEVHAPAAKVVIGGDASGRPKTFVSTVTPLDVAGTVTNVNEFFQSNLTEGGKAFYGQRKKPALPKGVGRNHKPGQSYADIGHLPLHNKLLFPDAERDKEEVHELGREEAIMEQIQKLTAATKSRDHRKNKIRIRQAKKKYFEEVLNTDTLNQCRFSERLVYDLVPKDTRFTWLRTAGLEQLEDFEWSDEEDMTDLDDLLIQPSDLPPEVQDGKGEHISRRRKASVAQTHRVWDEDFLKDFEATGASKRTKDSGREVHHGSAASKGKHLEKESLGGSLGGTAQLKGMPTVAEDGEGSSSSVPRLPTLGRRKAASPRHGRHLKGPLDASSGFVHPSGAMTERGMSSNDPRSLFAQARSVEEMMKMHPDQVAEFLCSKHGRALLSLINTRHRKVLANRLHDLDQFRIENESDGVNSVLETLKLQVDNLTFKREALADHLARGKILDRSAEDARADVRDAAQKGRRRAHRARLLNSALYAALQRMSEHLRRRGQLDKPSLEFLHRARAIIAQGEELDMVYLFRLIRSNSVLTAAVQELIDVLLCLLKVPLPGYLMWCAIHGYNHDKQRIDEVLDAREEQRKRRARKMYLGGKDAPKHRRKHRLLVRSGTETVLPPVNDNTFITQGHSEGSRTHRGYVTYPQAPEARRAEPKGQERWRQNLSPRLRRKNVQRKRPVY